jgi:mRNA interferase RelE/StbE
MNVAFKNSFLKIIKKLNDDKLKGSISEAISNCENANDFATVDNCKKLTGYKVYYRIRIGDYRIGLKWEAEESTLYFVTFLHRKDIYRWFPKYVFF